MMPRSLTLVRHGESEGNITRTLFEQGTPHPDEPKLMKVHTSCRRLTPKGIVQARAAGVWLRENWFKPIIEADDSYRLYFSPFIRAEETAGYFGFGDEWYCDNRITERNWGALDLLTYEERMVRYADLNEDRDDDVFYWRPPDGETLQDVCQRLRDMTNTLHRECADAHVLMVCHGETMWAWRTLLEYWSSHDLAHAMRIRDDRTRHLNCRIIQYSRYDASGRDREKLCRVRFVNPVLPDDPHYNQDWLPIQRKTYTHEQLLVHAENFPRFLRY